VVGHYKCVEACRSCVNPECEIARICDLVPICCEGNAELKAKILRRVSTYIALMVAYVEDEKAKIAEKRGCEEVA